MKTMAEKERRQGYVDICAELQNLGIKIDMNTTATKDLGDRLTAVESVTTEWRGGLKVGRWVVGICLTIGAAVLGLGAIGK